MAGHLIKKNHDVTVFNRTPEKALLWQQTYGGEIAATPAQAAAGADFIFTCVGNDADLRQVTTGENGIFSTATPGAVVVDHTTTSAIVARELAAIAEASGFAFLDAPVSGGQAGAQNGVLSVMVTKMVNQICIAGLVQSLSEGIHFAKRAGLDIDKVMAVISKGAASSWQMQNRYKTMTQHEFNFGFAVDWMRKDLGIAMQEAEQNGASLPVTHIVDGYYAEVQKMGGKRWDTSSLIALLEKK